MLEPHMKPEPKTVQERLNAITFSLGVIAAHIELVIQHLHGLEAHLPPDEASDPESPGPAT